MASKLRANALQTLARSVRASAISPAPLRPHLRPYPNLPRTLQPAQFSRRYAHAIPKPSRPAAPATSSPSEEIKQRKLQEPHYELTFTCVPCSDRSTHTVSKQGYHKGSVLITCPSCRNRHIISDHLNIFGDRKITVEDLMRERGQLVKRGTLGEDGDVEFWEDGTVTERNKETGTETATSSSAHSDGASASQQPGRPLTDSPARPQLDNAQSSATNTASSNRREFSTFGRRDRNDGILGEEVVPPKTLAQEGLVGLGFVPKDIAQKGTVGLGVPVLTNEKLPEVVSQREQDPPARSKFKLRKKLSNTRTPEAGRAARAKVKLRTKLANARIPEAERERDPPARSKFKLRKWLSNTLIPEAERELYGQPDTREARLKEIRAIEAAEKKARKVKERGQEPKRRRFTLRKYTSIFEIPGYIGRALPKREPGSSAASTTPSEVETKEAPSPAQDEILTHTWIPSTKLRRREVTSFVYAWPSDGMDPVRIGVTRPRKSQNKSQNKGQSKSQ
ncbi:hypothetical protein PG996_000470 [Apiospora saccharicola]|uniref:DNL-type domain-containing protein n=1 Tax=Apiospora saccharicola TaxID=335842 RepID=A0ABR1WDU7_9PEZI